MKLFLVRHGESEGNLGNHYHGQTDVKLTERGREQAESIRPILAQIPFDKVYSSDLSRAADTCATALPGMPFEKMPLLREVDVGSIAGREYGTVDVPEPEDVTMRPDYTPFGGENLHLVLRRARKFLDMLAQEDYKYVAAFSHYGFMNCLLREVLETHYLSAKVISKNCAIHVLEYNDAQWKIAALNYMSPIDLE